MRSLEKPLAMGCTREKNRRHRIGIDPRRTSEIRSDLKVSCEGLRLE